MRTLLRRFERGPFEAAVSFAAVVSSVAYMLDPSGLTRAAIGRAAPTLLPYWSALYGAGGLLVLVGMGVLSLRVEVLGLLIFTAAVVVNGIAIGYSGVPGAASAMTFAALGLACLLRAAFLWRAWRSHVRGQ